jgi:hypothetical protein
MLNFAEQTGSGVCVLTVTGFALQHLLDFVIRCLVNYLVVDALFTQAICNEC